MSLIEMGVWAVVIACVAGAAYKAWDGFKTSIAAPYVQEQIDADKVILARAKADTDDAKDRQAHAEADRDGAFKAAELQTKAILEANEAIKKAQDAARASSVLYAQEVAKNSARITRLQSAASAPNASSRECKDVLSATDAILRESSRERATIKP